MARHGSSQLGLFEESAPSPLVAPSETRVLSSGIPDDLDLETCRFLAQPREYLRSAATMLFSPGFHARPVKLFLLDAMRLVIREVSLNAELEPIWVRGEICRPEPLTVATWIWQKRDGSREGFSPLGKGITYLYDDQETYALGSALIDAKSMGLRIAS